MISFVLNISTVHTSSDPQKDLVFLFVGYSEPMTPIEDQHGGMIFYLPPPSRLVVCETILHQRIVLFFFMVSIYPSDVVGVNMDPWTLELSSLSSFTSEYHSWTFIRQAHLLRSSRVSTLSTPIDILLLDYEGKVHQGSSGLVNYYMDNNVASYQEVLDDTSNIIW